MLLHYAENAKKNRKKRIAAVEKLPKSSRFLNFFFPAMINDVSDAISQLRMIARRV